MKYHIEYADGRRHETISGRKDLLERLKSMKAIDAAAIADIRKVNKNGISQTVMEIYENYIKKS